MNRSLDRLTPWHKLLAGILILLAVVLSVAVFFPWDVLREPLNRHVSAKLDRRFEITRRLDVHLGRSTTVVADGVMLANPPWARDPFLLKADSAELEIKLWPLLLGRVEIPRVSLKNPQFGLQVDAQQRRTWALSRDTSDAGAAPEIGALVVDGGALSYLSAAQGADIVVRFSLVSESTSDLPLAFNAKGLWQKQAFTASGRTGGVLRLSRDQQARFPFDLEAKVGFTSLKSKGSVSDLANLSALDASFDVQGQSLGALYKIVGVALPDTPPYKLRGQITKQDQLWAVDSMQGTLGSSDLNGNLSFDQSRSVAKLNGKLQSKLLDFNDLAPIVGIAAAAKPAGGRKSAAAPTAASPKRAAAPRAKATRQKVLPTAPLDLQRLNAINAGVSYSAASIRHAPALPLDSANVQVNLSDGVLELNPLSLGVAGGKVTGTVRIDSRTRPASLATRLDIRGAQLNQLFPTIETSRSSLGRVSGQLDLSGRGNSAADMLGSSSGDLSVLMGRGEISNILLEYMGLDGGEIIKFLIRGDRNVQLRCAVAAFDVKQGLMTSRAIVLDTVDTVIQGSGRVNLADESLDVLLEPVPKDFSILSLRSPLRIGGTFAAPTAGPDKAALAGRGALALALGLVNPLLALAATIETGPGEDADCAAIFAQGKPDQPRPGAVPRLDKAPRPLR